MSCLWTLRRHSKSVATSDFSMPFCTVVHTEKAYSEQKCSIVILICQIENYPNLFVKGWIMMFKKTLSTTHPTHPTDHTPHTPPSHLHTHTINPHCTPTPSHTHTLPLTHTLHTHPTHHTRFIFIKIITFLLQTWDMLYQF